MLNSGANSEVWPVLSLVEVLKEFALALELDFIVVAEPLVLRHVAPSVRRQLVEDDATPDVSILHVVQTFVARAHKHVNVMNVTHLHLRSPVGGHLHLRCLGGRVPLHAVKADEERHIAAVLSEEAHTLEVGFRNRPRACGRGYLVMRHDTGDCNVVDCWEVVACIFFQTLIGEMPT